MTSERIKEIQEGTAYPESASVMLALKQVWNECSQQSEAKDKEIEELRSYKNLAKFWVVDQKNEITQLKQQLKAKEERDKEVKIMLGRSRAYLDGYIKGELNNFHKENAKELSEKIDNFLASKQINQ